MARPVTRAKGRRGGHDLIIGSLERAADPNLAAGS